MVDSVAANPGTGGDSFALDRNPADSVDWPFCKVAWGTFHVDYKPVDLANALPVQPGTGAVFAVSGTFFQSTQPISAASLPLPSGASTAANQATEIASLANLDVALSTRLKPADTLAAVTVLGSITSAVAVTGAFFQGTQPVSAASLPLPAGAATSALQTTGNTSLANLDVALSTRLKPADTLTGVTTVAAVTAITNALPAGTNALGSVKRAPDATSTFASTGVDSTALEASHVLKAGAGVLHGLSGYNSKTSSQFIQIHNTTTLPADTAVPLVVFIVQASSNFSIDFGLFGKNFSTGITVCNSSTAATKTIGAADCWFNGLFA